MTPLEEVFRTEWPRLVAALGRRFGDLDLAEEAAAEALARAVERWPEYAGGVPPNPGGWLMNTATRRAIDRLRREGSRDARQREALMLSAPPEPVGAVEDDTLRLMVVCCHPALAMEARVALTLRMVGGLTVPEIARAFLVQEATMAQRLTRAKRRIRDAGIAFRLPEREELAERLGGVQAVLYLVFNEGYVASAGAALRVDLTDEAIRLTRLLHALVPDDAETTGLLALMLLTEARRGARLREEALVPLDEQDRSRWDRSLIAEGHALVRSLLAGTPGPYQLQAAINAVHTSAPTFAATDWSQVVALYDRLQAIAPSPIVELNRAVAVGEIDGPDVALALVERLPLEHYHPWQVVRAELLARVGRTAESQAAYARAIELTGNPAERAFLRGRADRWLS